MPTTDGIRTAMTKDKNRGQKVDMASTEVNTRALGGLMYVDYCTKVPGNSAQGTSLPTVSDITEPCR